MKRPRSHILLGKWHKVIFKFDGYNMLIKENKLRAIIRKELLREMQDLSVPIPILDLQFVPDEFGMMMVPGEGFSHGVREHEFEDWKTKTVEKYGPDVMVSSKKGYPKSLQLHSQEYEKAVDRENQKFLKHHQTMEKQLGRKLSY